MKEHIKKLLNEVAKEKQLKEFDFSFGGHYKDITPIKNEIIRSLDLISSGDDDCISKSSIIHLINKSLEASYDIGRQHGIVRK